MKDQKCSITTREGSPNIIHLLPAITNPIFERGSIYATTWGTGVRWLCLGNPIAIDVLWPITPSVFRVKQELPKNQRFPTSACGTWRVLPTWDVLGASGIAGIRNLAFLVLEARVRTAMDFSAEYPYEDGKWETRDPKESPRSHVSSPGRGRERTGLTKDSAKERQCHFRSF